MRMTIRRWVQTCLAAALTLPALAWSVPNYTGMYVIGDSLSDTGNVQAQYNFLLALGGLPPGAPPSVPSSAYYQGRFTNGPNYVDVLAGKLGLSVAPSLLGGSNYAYGAARTDYHPSGFPFRGILDQKGQLLAQHPVLDSNALYVVFGGSNNIQDLLTGTRDGNSAVPPSTVAETVNDIAGVLDDLYNAGARNFLVGNTPNVGLVPRIREKGASAVAGASFLSAQLHAGFDAMIDAKQALGYNIAELDTYSLLNDLLANAAAQGITNVTDRCYGGDDLTWAPPAAGSTCGSPSSYLWWDGIHPTAKVHQILGEAAYAALVPEPETYVLLGVGGLLVLAVSRRRVA
ncbi:MAG: SGNH/GDSL hydrolase family protein [Burkholderiales bacterium]